MYTKYSMNDFFCGCGGIGLGFKQAGFHIAGAWDSNKYAVQTYKENVWAGVKQADIRDMDISDIPEADVWAFGFPCQDLSVAGLKAGIRVFLGNGTVRCRDCSYHFGVVDYGITSDTVSNTGHPVKRERYKVQDVLY